MNDVDFVFLCLPVVGHSKSRAVGVGPRLSLVKAIDKQWQMVSFQPLNL